MDKCYSSKSIYRFSKDERWSIASCTLCDRLPAGGGGMSTSTDNWNVFSIMAGMIASSTAPDISSDGLELTSIRVDSKLESTMKS